MGMFIQFYVVESLTKATVHEMVLAAIADHPRFNPDLRRGPLMSSASRIALVGRA